MGSLQLGIPITYAMISVVRKFPEQDSKTRCSIRQVGKRLDKGHVPNFLANRRVGTFGAILEVGVEKQVTKHSVLGAAMVVGVPTGVTLRIRLSRGQQTYAFPLHLSDEVRDTLTYPRNT